MKIIAHSESQEVNLVAKLAELGFGQFDSDLDGPESELGKDAENQNQKRLAARVLKYASVSSSLHLFHLLIFPNIAKISSSGLGQLRTEF